MKKAEREKKENITFWVSSWFYNVERCFAADYTEAEISFVTPPGSKTLEFNQNVSITCSIPVSFIMSFVL